MQDQTLAPPAPESMGSTSGQTVRPQNTAGLFSTSGRPAVTFSPALVATPAFGQELAHALEQRVHYQDLHEARDLRRNYLMYAEVGGIIALLLLIGLFHLNLQFEQEFENTVVEQETVQMEEIINTKQDLAPPPPPKPMAPVVVSDNVEIDDVDLRLDAALDIGEAVEALPPPPPSPEPVAEEEEEEYDEIFVVVEQMPELIGGIEGIQEKLRYPEMARMAGISGRVFVQFIVDKQGNVVDPVVIRGIGGGCDEEAIRAVSEAKFRPGMQRGKAVRVRYVLPVLFKLK